MIKRILLNVFALVVYNSRNRKKLLPVDTGKYYNKKFHKFSSKFSAMHHIQLGIVLEHVQKPMFMKFYPWSE
jgi:hypothetical protein